MALASLHAVYETTVAFDQPQRKDKAMSTTNLTNTAPFGAIATYRAINAVETVLSSLIAWNAKRVTFKQLNALTVRELEDIGLSDAKLKSRSF